MGHHLPGMIRALCDSALFHRFAGVSLRADFFGRCLRLFPCGPEGIVLVGIYLGSLARDDANIRVLRNYDAKSDPLLR